MSDRAAPAPIVARARLNAGASEIPIWISIIGAGAAAIALTWPTVSAVWSSGQFLDTDDAMRAVQVRDLLAGQSWFDMTAYRLDPPGGMFAHWSRIVDAPIAVSEMVFRLFLSPETAERATRLVFPFVLFLLLLRLVAWCAEILGGASARHAAIWTAFFTGAMFMQFLPGRIDHHAPQIVLLMTSLCCFLTAMRPDRPRAMAGAAAAMALSLAISLENLPFFIIIVAALPALFILEGEKARAQLNWFAVGALAAFPLCFATTVAPSRYFISVCDAYSTFHLAAAVVGALALALLAGLAPRLIEWPQRMLACGFAGAAVIGAVALIAPRCLGDPFVELDPLLRELWLSHVKEAQPLLRLWSEQPGSVVAVAAPVFAGLVVALGFAFSTEGAVRKRWCVIAAAIAVGFAAGLWQVRVFTSVAPIAAAATAVGVVAVARRLAHALGPVTRSLVTALLCFALSSMGVALALPREENETSAAAFACYRRAALEPLNGLSGFSSARIAAPIEMGAFILAFTPHSVFAAPYHRDNHGNRVVVDAYLAEPGGAEKILRAAGADLLIWCASEARDSTLSKRPEASLAAGLARGEIPDWLEPRGVAGGVVHVFALRPKQ